jgi:transposase
MTQKTLFTNKNANLKKAILRKKPIFKSYTVYQDFLLPKKVSDFIPKNHLAFLLDKIIESMDTSSIEQTYLGGGTSAYNPKMMLKVWILGFIYKIYTCRPLAKSLRENMPFIWISGNQTPDFHTLNNFRLRLKDDIKIIFKGVIHYALESGLIDGKEVFIDHSKTEANANRHKMVWRKQIEKSLVNIDKEIDDLFEHIDKLNEDEDKRFVGKDFPEQERDGFDDDKVKEIIEKLNRDLKKKKISPVQARDSKKKIRRFNQLLNRKAEYIKKKKNLGERNSFSRTDADAVAMMQKDKVSIKPGYNEGICTQKGFVLNYILSQNCADNVSFIPLMEGVKENLDKVPESAVSDAGYGNEENHLYLEKNKIQNFLKYNTYHKEKSKAWLDKKIRLKDFSYDDKKNQFACPNGKKMNFFENKEYITKTGYKQIISIYKCEIGACKYCRLKKKCLSEKNVSDTRTLQLSWQAERLKLQARQNLDSEIGKKLRKKRANEVESVFGDEKQNKNKRRFILRGLEKVNIEAGLYYLAHNIRKIQILLEKRLNKTFESIKNYIDMRKTYLELKTF